MPIIEPTNTGESLIQRLMRKESARLAEGHAARKRYDYLCITASHWDGLPEAFRQMQEAIDSDPQPLPSAEVFDDFDEVNLLTIYVGQKFPMVRVLRLPMPKGLLK